jgi:transposase
MKKANEEIRSIVVKAFLSGTASRRKLAEIFGYTPASISNWVREYKQEQRLTPRPAGHRNAAFTDVELQELFELLKKNVDMTLSEIRDYFCKECSLVAIHNAVNKLGFVLKKNSKGKRTRSRGYQAGA